MDSQPENDPPMIISDRVRVNGVVTPLTLTADGELRWTESGRRKSTVEKDILSFVEEGNKVRVKTFVERGGGICCEGSGGDYGRKDFVFEPLSDESRKLWCDKLHQHLQSLGRPKKLLVFVNPFGGKKTARKIFLEEVKPLFEDANVQLEIQESCFEWARSLLTDTRTSDAASRSQQSLHVRRFVGARDHRARQPYNRGGTVLYNVRHGYLISTVARRFRFDKV